MFNTRLRCACYTTLFIQTLEHNPVAHCSCLQGSFAAESNTVRSPSSASFHVKERLRCDQKKTPAKRSVGVSTCFDRAAHLARHDTCKDAPLCWSAVINLKRQEHAAETTATHQAVVKPKLALAIFANRRIVKQHMYALHQEERTSSALSVSDSPWFRKAGAAPAAAGETGSFAPVLGLSLPTADAAPLGVAKSGLQCPSTSIVRGPFELVTGRSLLTGAFSFWKGACSPVANVTLPPTMEVWPSLVELNVVEESACTLTIR